MPADNSAYSPGLKPASGSPAGGSIFTTSAPCDRRWDAASGPGTLTAIVTMRRPESGSMSNDTEGRAGQVGRVRWVRSRGWCAGQLDAGQVAERATTDLQQGA